MPLVTAPARAVIVTVPAAGVFAAIVPTFQRTIVPDGLGITVGAPSDGDDELLIRTRSQPAACPRGPR